MSPALPVTDEDIDWNEVWKVRQIRHDSARLFDDPSHDWNKRENAQRYDANTKSEYDERIKTTIAGLDISKNSRVLDIGAGPGTLALPLSPLVKEVTAIEPGAGMIGILNEQMAKNHIANIRTIQSLWEDIEPARDLKAPYDIVIASLSLTMEDIREALTKMNAVASQCVYLYWFMDSPFWEQMYGDLWQSLHGSTYFPGPKADCLWNVLCQMGIYANVEILPLRKEYRFSTRDEMMVFFKHRFNAKTPEQERVLIEYITPLIREEESEVVISGDSTFAKIWWKNERAGS